MPSTLLFSSTVSESPLPVRMSFLRKYFGAVGAEFLLMSITCTLIMLSPLARFYITENLKSKKFCVNSLTENDSLNALSNIRCGNNYFCDKNLESACCNGTDDWLLFFVFFLFCASYLSLVNCIKLPMLNIILIFHIIIQALTVGILVTFNDLMFLYQGIIITTFTLLGFFIYTLQSKWNLNICAVMFISCSCILTASGLLKALFGGTKEENILSILVSFFIIGYHSYALFRIVTVLTATDFSFAIINAHLLPINHCVFSSHIYKPQK